jgi:Leucine-rich repeat (LRR) protein
MNLDITNNTDLNYLHCYNNKLKSLDLTNNPLLKRVSLKGNPGDWWKELEKEEE